jgi:hypothetical protein
VKHVYLKTKSRRRSVPNIIISKHQSEARKNNEQKPLKQSLKTKENNEKITNEKRDTSLPPLKYKFLEQMKHQISALERDSPNIFTKYCITI